MARSAPSRSLPCRRLAGFSVVELMVAVMIGIIASIVIFQVYGVFESQKRTTTSAGDAQQNGLAALLYLERDARMAGYGINGYVPLLGCTVNAYDANGARSFTFPLAAVQIAKGASTSAPDAITYVYGSSSQRVYQSKLTQANTSGQTFNKIDSSFGHFVGDLIILGQAGQPCTMRQVTAVPSTFDEVDHAAGARYNNTGGPPVYTAWDNTAQSGGLIFNLGSTLAGNPQPVVATYSVANSQLSYWNQIQASAGSAIVEGIVHLRAQYGLDANGDGFIQSSEWQDGCTTASQLPVGAGTPPACIAPAASDWAKILAIRIAVVARSAQPERPDPATGNCTTTTTSPTWTGGTLDLNLTAVPDNKCYRYRVFETSVAVRNSIWKPL
jgi:type IV pilus assembly protein PilW